MPRREFDSPYPHKMIYGVQELTCEMAYPGLLKFSHCYPWANYPKYGLAIILFIIVVLVVRYFRKKNAN